MKPSKWWLIAMLAGSVAAWAETPADEYPESLLYDRPTKVADGVYSAIGQLGYYTYENAGHNNNLSFVIGSDAVLVVNSSTSYLLAKALHDEIKKLTDLPVKYVVVENGQTHAAGGNNYWQEQGAEVISHIDAVESIEKRVPVGLRGLEATLKERLEGTVPAPVDVTFEDTMTLDLGGLTAELMYLGIAHAKGDISILIPERDVVIAGDIAFYQRMLAVDNESSTVDWMDTWHNAFAPLAEGKIIIPGHGDPTDFASVDRDTRSYIEYLRTEVGKILEEGGSLADAYKIDQSQFMHLEAADQLAGKNAGRIFEAMEWE